MTEKKTPKKPLIFYAVVAMIILLVFNLLFMPALNRIPEVPYNFFVSSLEQGNVQLVEVQDTQIAFITQDEAGQQGIYVTGFYYPVVPQGKARIRTQMSAAHTKEDIDKCVAAFVRAKNEIGF